MGINHARNGSAQSARDAHRIAVTTDRLADRRSIVDRADSEFGMWETNPWRKGGIWGPSDPMPQGRS